MVVGPEERDVDGAWFAIDKGLRLETAEKEKSKPGRHMIIKSGCSFFSHQDHEK